MPVFCLSFHAAWQCRHAGACCTAGWSIPVERHAFERVRVHFATRSQARPRLITDGTLPEGAAAMLGTGVDGACAFFDGRLCEIHSKLGPQALPTACQQFPRIALHDPRGTFVTLSHFCPTAARLLVDDRGDDDGLAVVPAPARFSSPAPLDGLDAVQALPPLLTPRVLADIDGYAEWERQCLAILACGTPAEHALDVIESATGRLAGWRPGESTLAEAASAAFGVSRSRPGAWSTVEDERRFRIACTAVPPGLAAPVLPDGLAAAWHETLDWWPAFGAAARRFAAAHLFGNWVAYHATSLATVVEALKIGLSVLRVEAARSRQSARDATPDAWFLEAVRRADLLLVHLADTSSFVRAIETDDHFRSRSLPSLRRHRHPVG